MTLKESQLWRVNVRCLGWDKAIQETWVLVTTTAAIFLMGLWATWAKRYFQPSLYSQCPAQRTYICSATPILCGFPSPASNIWVTDSFPFLSYPVNTLLLLLKFFPSSATSRLPSQSHVLNLSSCILGILVVAPFPQTLSISLPTGTLDYLTSPHESRLWLPDLQDHRIGTSWQSIGWTLHPPKAGGLGFNPWAGN